MKYMSVVVFAAIMSWTWFVINSEPAVSMETHVGIQSKLAALIEESIQKQKPEARDFKIESMWTEALTPEGKVQIRAHFSYRFTEPTQTLDETGKAGETTSTIGGEALLEKQSALAGAGSESGTDAGLDTWAIVEKKFTSDAITFNDALLIKTGDTPEPATPEGTDTDSSSAHPPGAETH